MIYNDLALFTTVAEHLSFSAASKQTGIPLSRVSRRIGELEHHLGVKLFERTTRQVRLTEEGRRLLDRCHDPIEALQDIAGFLDETKRQTIRITAPHLAIRTSIGPHLLDFAHQYPEVKIDLTASNVGLDFFRDNIDLAFRLGPLKDSNLMARRLWPVPYCFCAGRNFMKENNIDKPISLSRLTELPAIVSRQRWFLEKGEQVQLSHIVHEFDDLELIREAVRRGMGVAMLPCDMVTDDMQELIVKNAKPVLREMFAVYPSKRLLPARVRNLIDFMAG